MENNSPTTKEVLMNRVNHSSKTTTTAKPILRIMLILGILVQTLAFTACSGGDDGDGGGSSPSGGGSPETVPIGSQVWMAKNMDVDVPGSECYDKEPENCAKYGRLYDWATAMALPPSCNSSNCASQVSAKHQGICPSGWHIPSNDDWEALISYVGGSSVAGKHLKATSGWYESGNGLDTHGFAALPGGDGSSGGSFNGAGIIGNWWSASEGDSDLARLSVMYFIDEYVRLVATAKADLLSVRCLQD